MKEVADELLWNDCLEGSKDAFEEIYKRYYFLLYNYGCKISSDEALVCDCIQNLFMKLIQNYRNLSPTVQVRGYLLKAFRYKLYDTIRNEGVRNRLLVPCMDEILLFEQEPSYHLEDYENTEEYKIVYFAFQQLSSRQKEILYLYYVAELSHTDIAEALNINYQSSKNLLGRSLLKLKENYFRFLTTSGKDVSDLPPDFSIYSLLQ